MPAALPIPEDLSAASSSGFRTKPQRLEPDVQAVLVPDNITLVPLPPYSPELNPIERAWLPLAGSARL